MPQTPPERKLELPADPPRKAGVIPFERPQNDAQRSIRKRVQERLDRESVGKPRIKPLRLVLTLAVAIIPVVLTFGASDAVLRKIQLLTKLYTADSSTTQEAQPLPAEEDTPGLLFLMPDPALSPGSQPNNAAPPGSGAAPAQQPAPAPAK